MNDVLCKIKKNNLKVINSIKFMYIQLLKKQCTHLFLKEIFLNPS